MKEVAPARLGWTQQGVKDLYQEQENHEKASSRGVKGLHLFVCVGLFGWGFFLPGEILLCGRVVV